MKSAQEVVREDFIEAIGELDDHHLELALLDMPAKQRARLEAALYGPTGKTRLAASIVSRLLRDMSGVWDVTTAQRWERFVREEIDNAR